jgi:alkylhydroperoxidase family enzyme
MLGGHLGEGSRQLLHHGAEIIFDPAAHILSCDLSQMAQVAIQSVLVVPLLWVVQVGYWFAEV